MKYSTMNEFRFKCRSCWKKFPTKTTFDLHKATKHKFIKVWLKNQNREKRKQSLHKCATCSKEFASKLTHELHFKRKHNRNKEAIKTEIDIEEVKIEVNNQEERKEKIVPESATIFACSFCNKKYSNSISLRHHARVHFARSEQSNEVKIMINQILNKCTISHSTKTYMCGICNMHFKSRITLKSHIISMHISKDLRKFKCQYCNKSFIYKAYLDNHLLSHTGEKPIVCALCGWKGRNKGNLTTHMKLKHARPESNRYSCKFCSKSFNLLSNCKRHLIVHRNEKEFDLVMGTWKHTCNQCGRKCSSASFLNTHMKIHSNEKTFSCELCSYKCFTLRSLKTHTTTYHVTMENWKYKCERCDTKLPTRPAYRRHFLKHSGYQCNVCGEQFKNENLLTHHGILVHKRESYGEVKCEQCHKKFISKKQLSKHRKVHVKSVKCASCNFACSTNTQLQAHFSRRHSHPDTWEHTCEHCSQKFATRGDKFIHLKREKLKSAKIAVVIKQEDD